MPVIQLRVLIAGLAVATVLLVGACKEDAPQKQPEPSPDVAQKPKVEVLDLDQVEQTLNAATDLPAAINALVQLAKALETPGAIPAEQVNRAQELRVTVGFALLTNAALAGEDANVKDIATALSLQKGEQGAVPTLQEYAAQIGAETVTGKAAAVVAWLAAPPDQRASLTAPDLDTWRSLVLDDAPAGVAVRAATLDALAEVLKTAADQGQAPSLADVAGALGPILCARCAMLPGTAPDALAGLLYDPANRGYVCEGAAAQLAGAAPHAYPGAVAAGCHPSDFGLTDPSEMSVLTAGNALALRTLTIALSSRRAPKDEKNPLAQALANAVAQSEKAVDEMVVPLALPWLPVPIDKQTERAADVIPPTHVTGEGMHRPAPPLETLVVDETGVALALRPVASVRRGEVVLDDRVAGYAFPGKQAIAVDAIQASDEKRAAEAKEKGEEVPDTDVIGEVADGLRQLGQQAAPIAERAFRSAAEPLRNASRAEDARTALLAVDDAAPAWLLRRALASLQAAGYRYPLVPRANAADLKGEQVLPLVFRSAEALRDSAVEQRFERPILVAIGVDAVEVYPPAKRIAVEEKGAEGTPAEPPPEPPSADDAAKEGATESGEAAASVSWPRGAERVLDPRNRLFSVKLALPKDGGALGADVAQTVQKLTVDQKAGNVVYVIADDKATAGRVLEIVDALTTAPGQPLAALESLEPGLQCEGATCPTRVVVLFPKVSRPRMPTAEKKEEPPPKKRDPSVATGPAGFCSKGNIQRVVTARSGSFRFCYEKELQLQPDLRGRLTVQFTIGRDGTVPKAEVRESTIKQRKVEQCVLKTFRGMRFDKPQGGICVVSWPLKFQ